MDERQSLFFIKMDSVLVWPPASPLELECWRDWEREHERDVSTALCQLYVRQGPDCNAVMALNRREMQRRQMPTHRTL